MVSYPCGPPSSLDTEVRHAALVQTWWPLTASVAQVSEIGNGLAAPASACSRTQCGTVGYVLGPPWRRRPQGSVQIDVHARVRATTAASTSDSETGAWATATGSVLPQIRIGAPRLPPQRGQLGRNSTLRRSRTGMARPVCYAAVMADLSSRNGWGVDPFATRKRSGLDDPSGQHRRWLQDEEKTRGRAQRRITKSARRWSPL